MRLVHLHLPKPIPYLHSLHLQELVLARNYAYNEHMFQSARQKSPDVTKNLTQPQPTLLTFQTEPVYTVGRRHLKTNPLSQQQVDFLTTNTSSPESQRLPDSRQLAAFFPTPRGGLLTYHAPGQLTAYLILNLRDHGITPRCFIRLWENVVIGTCAKHGVNNTLTTDDPGVWIGERLSESQAARHAVEDTCGGGGVNLTATTRKVCAIGVHVTRGITSHGIGLNITDTVITPPSTSALYTLPSRNKATPQPAPGYLSWGFDRIVACGLEGKSVTWLAREGAANSTTVEAVASTLSEQVRKGITKQGKFEITDIERIREDDILNDQPHPA